MDGMMNIFNFIKDSITSHVNYHPTLKYQIPLSQRQSGLGLCQPIIYYPATKISVISNLYDKCDNNFRFDVINHIKNENNNIPLNKLNNINEYNKSVYKTEQKYKHYLNTLIDKFKKFLYPEFKYVFSQK